MSTEEQGRPDIQFSIVTTGADGSLLVLGSMELRMTAPVKEPEEPITEEQIEQMRASIRGTIAGELLGWLREWAPDILEEYAVEVRLAIVRDPVEMLDYLERHEGDHLRHWSQTAEFIYGGT